MLIQHVQKDKDGLFCEKNLWNIIACQVVQFWKESAMTTLFLVSPPCSEMSKCLLEDKHKG